jgi:hypothetical protein
VHNFFNVLDGLPWTFRDQHARLPLKSRAPVRSPRDRIHQYDRPTMFDRQASLDPRATFLTGLDNDRRLAISQYH